MSVRVRIYNEVHVDLETPFTLRNLEVFCEQLREAGAEGDLPIAASKTGSVITLSARADQTARGKPSDS